MKRAFSIIRVSAEDQLRGYGPDVQWFDDVLPNAPVLELEVSENFRAVMQESATGWDREQFQAAVRDALRLHSEGKVEALLFPRVDRETRFLFGSFPLLAEVIRAGMEVFFARERLRLDPDDSDSVERYFSKATQAQAYVETMRVNTMKARHRRATQSHKMPTGGRKWAFEYDPATGRYRKNEARAAWIAKCYHWVLDDGLSLYACCRRLEREGVPTTGYEMWARSVEKGRPWARRRPPSTATWFPGTLRGLLLDEANVGTFYAFKHETAKGKDGRKRQVAASPNKWVLVYEDPSQAIVTSEQYEAFKARMRRNQQNAPRNAKHPYPPLRGLVFCHLCGKRMAGCRVNTGYTYYKCQVCRNLVRAFDLWDEMRNGIKERLLAPERLLPAVKAQLESGRTLEKLEVEQARLEREVENWKQVRDKSRRLYFLKQSYTEEQYLADDREMERRQEAVARELEDVRGQVSRLKLAALEEDGIRRFCELAARNLENLDDAQWRVLLERMRLRVLVPPGEPVIVQVALPVAEPQSGAIAYQSSRSR